MEKNEKFEMLLIKKRLSKTKLAAKVGVTCQTVYYWSIGRNKPSYDKAVTLSKELDVPITQVYKMFKGERRK